MDPLTLLSKSKEQGSYWESQFQKARDARVTFERDWYLNMAFYFGKQYVSYLPSVAANLSNQRLVEPPAPRYRVRIVANKIMPAVRTEFVKLTKEEPQYYVKPESTEPSDVADARVGESLFNYCLDEYEFNANRRRSTWWALICGTSFMRTTMNEDKTLDYLPVTAFHLFAPNLMEQDIQKQPYLIHARAVDQEMIRNTFNVSKLKPTVENSNGAGIENVLMNTLGVRTPVKDADKQCYLKEIWIRPGINAKYPDGCLIVSVDGEIMSVESAAVSQIEEVGNELDETSQAPQETEVDTHQPYPYEHGKYPFQKIDHIPTGRFYGDSAIKYLIPLQKEYNRTRSQITESKNRMGKPQMAYVKGSIDPNMVTSEPGLMIPVQPGMEFPRPIQQPEMPGYVIQEQDRVLRDMDDIVQYEGAKNSTPPGVEAASAIAYLQEENDSKLYATVASLEDAVQQAGKQTLGLIKQFWEPERIVQVVSKNNTMEAYQFVSQTGQLSGTDLRVETGSMAPKSQAARSAQITELMKLGMLPPEKGLRYLQLNETNRLYDEMQAGARMAQRENYKISQGMIQQQLPVNSWDDDNTHMYEHQLYMNSQEFELLEDGPKQILEDHYLSHQLRISGQMAPPPQEGEDPNAGGIPAGVSGPTGPPEQQLPQSYQDNQSDPFQSVADGFLKNIPDHDRPIVEKYVREWDQGVSQRFQKLHQTYEPYKNLGDIEEIQTAMLLQSQINENPLNFFLRFQAAITQLQEDGILDPFEQEYQGEQEAQPEQQGQFNNDPELLERLSNLEQMLQGLGENFQQDQMSRQEAAEMQHLETVMNGLHNTYGQFDDDYVLLKISQGADPNQAVQAYKAMINGALGANKPAPPKLFGGGGHPGQPEVNLRDKKDRLAYIAERAAANRE